MQYSCLHFKRYNPYNESYKFGSKSKNIVVGYINNIYLNENIRLVNN